MAKSKRSTAVATQSQQVKSAEDPGKKLISNSPAVSLNDNVCRVCLNSEGIVAIFDGYGTDEQFRYCTLLEVSETDGLPNKLCQICTDHLKIAYDFRFQASYAEKYLRKTIFLPVLKKELDVEQDECNKKQLYEQSEVASLELAENMQEIDQLLASDVVEEELEPGLEISDNQINARSNFSERDENTSESDGLSDHFSDAFSAGGDNINIDSSEKDNKYEINTKKLQKPRFGEKRHFVNSVSTNLLSTDTQTKLKQDSNAEISYDYYYSSKETLISDHPSNVCEKQTSSQTKAKDGSSQNSEIKEKSLKLLEMVQLQDKEANHNKEKIECNICGTNFTHINSLKQHLMKHSGEKPFKCEFCEKCFARKTILTIHRRLHTGDRPYRCDECINKFVTKEALNRHKEREHSDHAEETSTKNKISFICSICDKTRCSKYSLAAHMRTHHPEKEDSLDEKKTKSIQRKETATQDKPRRPRLTVATKEKRSKSTKYCKICQQGFSSKWELVAHQRAHEINQIYECDVCRRAFEKKYQLLYHLQTHDNGEDLIKKYFHSSAATASKDKQCRALSKKRPLSDEEADTPLTQHRKNKLPRVAIRRSKRGKPVMAINETDSNVKENDLDTVKNNSNVSPRKAKRTASKVNRVENVDKAPLSSPCALTKCRAPRENLKSFKNELKCQLCKRSFTHSTSLKIHMMKHSGDRPFQCDHCGKSFGRRNVLNIHRRLHTGEKPYKCPLCESAFVTKEALLRHVAKTHDQTIINDRRELTCGICHAVLPNKSLFDNHMRYHTEEKKHKDSRTKNQEQGNTETLPSFKCNLCGASFSCLSSYSCHLDVHEPPKNIQCDICKINFKEKFKLRYHMQQHKIEKESCKKCGEVFTIKEELIRHVKKKHVDARSLDYQCAECRIGLYDMRDLKEHLYEAHDVATQGLNACDVCRLDLNSGQEYYKHIYEMHDDVSKACTDCGDYFDSRKKFDEHFFGHYIS